VKIVHKPEQDSNDLEKCVQYILEQPERENHNIIVFGGGGRVDQEMSNLNVMYKRLHSKVRFVMISPWNAMYFLPPNEQHTITRNEKWEKQTCALVPLGQQCEQIETTGLKWDMNFKKMELRFGDMVSTSNEFIDKQVTVRASHPLLWISNLY
jgi:thiamine pyrophosphokinase